MDRETGKQFIINPAQQVYGQNEVEAIKAVAESGFWAEGPKALEFRRELAEYLGIKYVTLVNSGSSANLAALMSLTTSYIPEDRRIKAGHEVITTALSFPTTVSPIKHAGCIPVFVDVDPDTWNIDINQVEEMITENTKAIMVAHNLGNPFNLDAIMSIADAHGLWVIEDNCDSLGSEWNNRKTGTMGHIGTSSFYPAHHISTGEGGALYTNDPTIFRSIRSMVNWGRDCWCAPGQDNTCNKRYQQQFGTLPEGYDHKNTYTELGFNFKMTDLQAAIGVEQLKRLPDFVDKRKRNHRLLLDYFSAYEGWFDLPQALPQADPSWFGYVVKLTENAPFDKQTMIDYLQDKGIRSRAFFAGNMTRQPAIHNRDIEYKKHDSLDVCDDIMNNAFWIGVHPAIDSEQMKYMQYVLSNFLTNNHVDNR